MALTTDPRPLVPAFWMPTTKADDFAPTPPSVRRASLKGRMTPIARTEPM